MKKKTHNSVFFCDVSRETSLNFSLKYAKNLILLMENEYLYISNVSRETLEIYIIIKN